MCRYAQFTLSSRQLNYRGFPLIFLKSARCSLSPLQQTPSSSAYRMYNNDLFP
nr:MAG TPA: hypothetical protein [Caudoviricetes sp.]